MRAAFVRSLVELAERDRSVVLLTGDLGYTVLEPFANRFADRFFNVGVAEQNMVGLATGLAGSGFTPFVYSIATFASMRAYEFVRNGPVLHELPVRVVGVGGGLEYAHNGPTHHALEDVALMRAQPELSVLAPADAAQTEAAVAATRELAGPAYLRLGKQSATLPGLDGRFELGRAALIGEGRDAAIVSYGPIAHEAVGAAELLRKQGVEVTVAVTASLTPPPLEDLGALLEEVPVAVTLEAHYRNGGVGSLVSELVAERGFDCRVARIGVTGMTRGNAGSLEYLNERHGLTAANVAKVVGDALGHSHAAAAR